MSLNGMVALVTGGASGIGAATVRRLVKDGAKVAICDVNIEQARKLAEELGTKARAFQMDVSDATQVAKAVDDIGRSLGPIDVLVSCAGILLNATFLETQPKDLERILQVNLAGIFIVGQAVARTMTNRGGRIINIASAVALGGYPDRAAYSASKGGVVALTRAMAVELAPYGILVNAIAPGPVQTPMGAESLKNKPFHQAILDRVPVGRYSKPDEIADAIVYLASPGATFIVGQIISVDGGMSIAGLTPQAVAHQAAE